MSQGYEAVAPAASRRSRPGRAGRVLAVGATALLLGAALLALAGTGSERRDVLSASTGVVLTPPGENAEVDVSTEDVNAANAEVAADLNALETERAAKDHRGSVPTDEVEADAIIGNMDHYVRTMGEPYESVTGSHSDHAAEADAIIDNANKDSMDVTGKAGATIYQVASDPTAPASAWLRGSIPNYRAESAYIVSGVDGNYEKELENAPTMSVVGGKVPARQVAYTIVDEAYKDVTSPDCTGVVDKDCIHGVGRGTPPCQGTIAFKKPKNMAGNSALSHILFNITVDMHVGENVLAALSQRGTSMGACDEALQAKVRSALAQSAGVGSSDVIFPAPEAAGAVAGEGSGAGSGTGSGPSDPVVASSPVTQLERMNRGQARQMVRSKARTGPEIRPEIRARRQARTAWMSGFASEAQQSLGAEVRKVQGQLAGLQRRPTSNLAAAEAKALQGDTIFERKLAAAALQLAVTQSKVLKKASDVKRADSAAAKYAAQKASLLKKQERPFHWVNRRHLLQETAAGPETCTFSGYIIVPTADAFDARVNTEKQVSVNLIRRGLMALKSKSDISTTIVDDPVATAVAEASGTGSAAGEGSGAGSGVSAM